ncbi:MAG: DUF1573 domain-containing protein [Clostridia bacterium]|nr:DUF1573 domain-containing protein [Clostridia bacterium]
MRNTILLVIMLLSTSILFAQGKTVTEPDQTSKQNSIVFKSTVYDFGTIAYGEEAKGVFEFKNISKKATKLTNVKASCGCTGTEWPREEIKKRKKGEISVTYDTKRVGKFHKNVYVYVDGNSNPIQLEVKGEVLAGESNSKANQSVYKKQIDNSQKQMKIHDREANTTTKSTVKRSAPTEKSSTSKSKSSVQKKKNVDPNKN